MRKSRNNPVCWLVGHGETVCFHLSASLMWNYSEWEAAAGWVGNHIQAVSTYWTVQCIQHLHQTKEETASSTQLWSLRPANKWNCKTVAILIILRNQRVTLFYISDEGIIFKCSNVIAVGFLEQIVLLSRPVEHESSCEPLRIFHTAFWPHSYLENFHHVLRQVSKSI